MHGDLRRQKMRWVQRCHSNGANDFPTPQLSRSWTILRVSGTMVCKYLLPISEPLKHDPLAWAGNAVVILRRNFILEINDLCVCDDFGVSALRQIADNFAELHVLFNMFHDVMSHKSLKLRLLIGMARKPLTLHVEMRFAMDMFSPNVYEFAHNRVQEPVAPASGALAEDGECKALRELAALGDRVSAARLIV